MPRSLLPDQQRYARRCGPPVTSTSSGLLKPGWRHLRRPRLDGRPNIQEVIVSTSGADSQAGIPKRPRQSVTQLLAAKHGKPIRSLDDLTADTFGSDEELEDFLAFTYAERHRDLA
jgi:hypothetical protein